MKMDAAQRDKIIHTVKLLVLFLFLFLLSNVLLLLFPTTLFVFKLGLLPVQDLLYFLLCLGDWKT